MAVPKLWHERSRTTLNVEVAKPVRLLPRAGLCSCFYNKCCNGQHCSHKQHRSSQIASMLTSMTIVYPTSKHSCHRLSGFKIVAKESTLLFITTNVFAGASKIKEQKQSLNAKFLLY